PITGYAQDFLRESKINTLSRFIEQILASLEPNAAYPLHTIRRLVALLEKQNESALHWGDFGKPVSYAGENFIPLIEAFKLTGLLIENEDKTYTPQAFPEDKSETHIKMDGDFSCIIPPSAKFKDIWKIALFSTLNETGQVYRFEISKMSVIRGLDTGMNTEDLAPLLEKLTGNEPPQNMVYSLKDWTAQHSSVSLQTGTVLTLSPEMLYLAETPTIKRNIIRTLAPGVFILHSEERERDRKASVPGAETEDLAIRALHKAGVDILSRPSLAQSASNGRSNFPTLKRMSFQRSSVEEKAREKKNTDAATQLINRFKEFLTKKNFPQNVKDELTLRIKRKIIIDEAQLTIEAAGSEKTEARNLDIVGKTAVAKQAQITKSPVEVIWGKERAMGFIANMERKSGEYVIVVQAEGEKEPYHIPIGKVALIRRIKQSIYVQ
ncbi:MAG: helicase-associated domain-containing protein, partial [Spirochaetaceae bacterium]|nr:helicase-associated domain-containing protein [Spirochaetaceae bacterium]